VLCASNASQRRWISCRAIPSIYVLRVILGHLTRTRNTL
jgi:hypothetical protein